MDLQGNPVSPDGTGAFDPMPYQGTLFPEGNERDLRHGTSHYPPDAWGSWDHEVRHMNHMQAQEEATQGRDQRAAVLRKITMIRTGHRQ